MPQPVSLPRFSGGGSDPADTLSDVATTTPDDAEREQEEKKASPDHEHHARRPLWDLREDEKRLLAITAVGGLAANLGLVLIVGLAVVLLRQLRHHGEFHTLWAGGLTFVAGVLAGGLFSVVRLVRRGQPWSNALRALRWLTLLMATVIASVLVLAFIGYAAGLK